MTLDPRTAGWPVGSGYRYDWSSTTTIDVGGGAHAFDFDVTAKLSASWAASDGTQTTLYVQVDEVSVQRRVGDPKELEKLSQDFRHQGCFFVLSGGRLSRLMFPRGLSLPAANAFRQIASAFQFARAANGSDQYAAHEFDTVGEYVVSYAHVGDVWQKHKDRFVALVGAHGGGTGAGASVSVVPEIVASTGSVRLSPEGRPTSVEIHDELSISGAQAPVHTTGNVRLTDILSPAPAGLGRDRLSQAKDLVSVEASDVYGAPVTALALDRARIGGLTFGQIVSQLERLSQVGTPPVRGAVNGAPVDPTEQAQGEERTQERSKLFGALGATFRTQPETVARAMQLIRSKSPAALAFIDALGSSSSVPAQHALVELIHSKGLDPIQHERALVALSRSRTPTPDSIAALKEILAVEPSNMQALFGLGSFARRLRDEGSEEQASKIGDYLVSRLGTAPNKSQLVVDLKALANAGYDPALPAILPFASDDAEIVRVAAMRSLQSMHATSVDAILVDHLASDPANQVRLAAIEAVKLRRPTDVLVGGLSVAATSDADAHVRYRAVQALAEWLSMRSDIRSTLQQVASRDAEPRVRDLAGAAL